MNGVQTSTETKPRSRQTDPTGVADGWAHVLRDGCYYEWEESKVRVACRHMDGSDTCDDGYGLRLILTK